jgi:hypothetical protein
VGGSANGICKKRTASETAHSAPAIVPFSTLTVVGTYEADSVAVTSKSGRCGERIAAVWMAQARYGLDIGAAEPRGGGRWLGLG